MRQEQGFNPLELKLHMVMDRLSNGEPVNIENAWIEEAGEAYKSALRKQLRPEPRKFGLRMSNLGRPLCQLQHEQLGTPKARQDVNHILRMIIGDATEIAVNVILRAAEVNITGGKGRHEITVGETIVPGEDDVWIDNKVYDIKSASPYSFTHKWSSGWETVYNTDTFGYVAQLWAYAEKDPEKMGGWIVVDKSSGELKVVEATPSADQLSEIERKATEAANTLREGRPHRMIFSPEEETFYRKVTGNWLVPMTCTFCDYMKADWPTAELHARTNSAAKNPKMVWYSEYTDNGEVE